MDTLYNGNSTQGMIRTGADGVIGNYTIGQTLNNALSSGLQRVKSASEALSRSLSTSNAQSTAYGTGFSHSDGVNNGINASGVETTSAGNEQVTQSAQSTSEQKTLGNTTAQYAGAGTNISGRFGGNARLSAGAAFNAGVTNTEQESHQTSNSTGGNQAFASKKGDSVSSSKSNTTSTNVANMKNKELKELATHGETDEIRKNASELLEARESVSKIQTALNTFSTNLQATYRTLAHLANESGSLNSDFANVMNYASTAEKTAINARAEALHYQAGIKEDEARSQAILEHMAQKSPNSFLKALNKVYGTNNGNLNDVKGLETIQKTNTDSVHRSLTNTALEAGQGVKSRVEKAVKNKDEAVNVEKSKNDTRVDEVKNKAAEARQRNADQLLINDRRYDWTLSESIFNKINNAINYFENIADNDRRLAMTTGDASLTNVQYAHYANIQAGTDTSNSYNAVKDEILNVISHDKNHITKEEEARVTQLATAMTRNFEKASNTNLSSMNTVINWNMTYGLRGNSTEKLSHFERQEKNNRITSMFPKSGGD